MPYPKKTRMCWLSKPKAGTHLPQLATKAKPTRGVSNIGLCHSDSGSFRPWPIPGHYGLYLDPRNIGHGLHSIPGFWPGLITIPGRYPFFPYPSITTLILVLQPDIGLWCCMPAGLGPRTRGGGGSREKFSSQCIRQNFKTAFLCGPYFPKIYPFHTLSREQPPTKTGLSTLLTF